MKPLQIFQKDESLEIISKLMNSVAKKYDCRIEYKPESHEILFIGDSNYQKHITEETMALFPNLNVKMHGDT